MIGRLLNLVRSRKPEHPIASASLEPPLGDAIELINRNRADEAIDGLRRRIRSHPESCETWLWLARAYSASHETVQAGEAFFEAAECADDPVTRAMIRGEQARANGDIDSAVRELLEARAARPSDPEIANQLGLALEAADRLGEAESVFEQALAQVPGSRPLLSGLCNLRMRSHGFDAAAAGYEEVMRRYPRDAVLRYNFAVHCAAAGRRERAVTLLREALACDPQLGTARIKLALELFLLGRFPDACAAFEARWDFAANLRGGYRLPRERQWHGENLAAKSILLWAEQGLGDSIQMIRYATMPRLRGAAATHVRAPRSLLRLFSSIPGIRSWSADEDPAADPATDLHCPFMSLPLAFATTLDSIPADIPYLRAAPALVDDWRAILPPPDGRVRVGLVWRSDPRGDVLSTEARAQKSVPLAMLGPLAALRNISWVSLQMGSGRDELPTAPAGLDLVDPVAGIRDFADTAAIIEQLDLIVTVDTAVAHLAGAMGKPVLMLLKSASGLFWLTDRDDSPWYPGVLRIVRQNAPGDWTGPILRAAELVKTFLTRRTLWETQ
jgi:tetratricopeptide (TPR) repeat protein